MTALANRCDDGELIDRLYHRARRIHEAKCARWHRRYEQECRWHEELCAGLRRVEDYLISRGSSAEQIAHWREFAECEMDRSVVQLKDLRKRCWGYAIESAIVWVILGAEQVALNYSSNRAVQAAAISLAIDRVYLAQEIGLDIFGNATLSRFSQIADPGLWMPVSAAARVLGVKERQVYNLLRSGVIKGTRPRGPAGRWHLDPNSVHFHKFWKEGYIPCSPSRPH